MIEKESILDCLTDENGKRSAARVLLVACLCFTALLIAFDVVLWGDVPSDIYSLLGVVYIGLLSWCGAPRVAKHILPQIGAVASGIGRRNG
jgi:hypothetical protein